LKNLWNIGKGLQRAGPLAQCSPVRFEPAAGRASERRASAHRPDHVRTPRRRAATVSPSPTCARSPLACLSSREYSARADIFPRLAASLPHLTQGRSHSTASPLRAPSSGYRPSLGAARSDPQVVACRNSSPSSKATPSRRA
jgi:hypothetical protein